MMSWAAYILSYYLLCMRLLWNTELLCETFVNGTIKTAFRLPFVAFAAVVLFAIAGLCCEPLWAAASLHVLAILSRLCSITAGLAHCH